MMGMIIIHIKLNHHFFLPILVESASFLVGNDVWSFSLGGLDAAAAAHPRISTWWCPIWSTWWRLVRVIGRTGKLSSTPSPMKNPYGKKYAVVLAYVFGRQVMSIIWQVSGRDIYHELYKRVTCFFTRPLNISETLGLNHHFFHGTEHYILGTKHQLISSFAVPAWIVTSLAVISWLAWHWEERQTIRRSVFTFNHFQL